MKKFLTFIRNRYVRLFMDILCVGLWSTSAIANFYLNNLFWGYVDLLLVGIFALSARKTLAEEFRVKL